MVERSETVARVELHFLQRDTDGACVAEEVGVGELELFHTAHSGVATHAVDRVAALQRNSAQERRPDREAVRVDVAFGGREGHCDRSTTAAHGQVLDPDGGEVGVGVGLDDHASSAREAVIVAVDIHVVDVEVVAGDEQVAGVLAGTLDAEFIGVEHTGVHEPPLVVVPGRAGERSRVPVGVGPVERVLVVGRFSDRAEEDGEQGSEQGEQMTHGFSLVSSFSLAETPFNIRL